MKRLLLIVGFALIGAGGGGGAAIALRPPAESSEPPGPTGVDAPDAPSKDAAIGDTVEGAAPVFELPGRLVVPVLGDGGTRSVILSVAIETVEGGDADLRQKVPRIRAVLLSTLLAHANRGGFDGRFTAPDRMIDLVAAMETALRTGVDAPIGGVLVTDIIAHGS